MATQTLFDSLFALSDNVRYVALRLGDDLNMRQRSGIHEASSSESDRYEELLVNPTLLTLVGQRGRIDCGGLGFVLIRYGNFFQLIYPLKAGHVSIAIEPEADPLRLVAGIRHILNQHNLLPLA